MHPLEYRKMCMCDNKLGHRTRQDAKQAKAALQRISKDPISIYKCPYCKLWHIGRDHK
jgi:hypothetical protein